MSRALSLAGFQVTLIGRFWVTTEASLPSIFIVDDNDQFRRHLRSLIESQDDWKVCCEAADGGEAVEKYGPANPQLTVMDFNMPGLDGLKASREILAKNPDAPTLMVTVFKSSQLADEAKRAGIKGFCSKIHIDCITEAINALLQGRTYFSDAG
jgi:DNA-binding NarL/FixJ family response regulator